MKPANFSVTIATMLTAFTPLALAFTVVIDPGHGGSDLGARYGGIFEKHLVQELSLALRDELEQEKDIKVLLTRETDNLISLADRVQITDKAQADIFISIHANASQNRKVKGAEFYLRSLDLAAASPRPHKVESDLEIILNELHHQGQFLNSLALSQQLSANWPIEVSSKSLRQAPFYVLNKTQSAPAVLIEIGYMSHPGERKRLREPSVQKEIVKGIKQTLLSYRENFLRANSLRSPAKE